MKDHAHAAIWLEPWCDDCAADNDDTGRTWCQNPVYGACEECGALPVKYILAPDQPQKSETAPMSCIHDLADQETAAYDGMCPICLGKENERLRAECEHLKGLLADKKYIRYLADYQRGHLSYYGMLQDREKPGAKPWS